MLLCAGSAVAATMQPWMARTERCEMQPYKVSPHPTCMVGHHHAAGHPPVIALQAQAGNTGWHMQQPSSHLHGRQHHGTGHNLPHPLSTPCNNERPRLGKLWHKPWFSPAWWPPP
jgi:hypothetical protein